MFDWGDARYYLAVQRAGTLSAAAAALGVNQTTVGRRIAALEGELCARLFIRTRDGYALTRAGEQLLVRAERIEAEALSAERELSGQASELTGSVRITAPVAFSVRFMAPLMLELHARLPELALELVADNRVFSLTKREADVAVRIGRPADPSLVGRRLADYANGVYASRTYLERRGGVGADFAGHDVIAPDGARTADIVWFEQRARRSRAVLKSNSTLVDLAAALGGVGLAILPCYIGDAEPDLVRVVGPDEVPSQAVWLLMHRDLQHAARIRACVDFLIAAVRARADALAGRAPDSPPPRRRRPRSSRAG